MSDSRFAPGMELDRNASVRARRLSSRSFSCFRVIAFFFFFGMGIDPFVGFEASSPELAAELGTLDGGLPALLPARLASLLAVLELGLLSSKASSTTAALPLWVRWPASTFQISGQRAPTNSSLCEIHTKAPAHSLMATASPPSASLKESKSASSVAKHLG